MRPSGLGSHASPQHWLSTSSATKGNAPKLVRRRDTSGGGGGGVSVFARSIAWALVEVLLRGAPRLAAARPSFDGQAATGVPRIGSSDGHDAYPGPSAHQLAALCGIAPPSLSDPPRREQAPRGIRADGRTEGLD